MWQRIQTVFLGIGIASLVGSLLFPIWIGVKETGLSYALYPIHFMTNNNGAKVYSYFPFCATAVLIAAALTIAVMEIRRYDDRILQIKLGTLNTLILAGAMVCAVVLTNQVSKAQAPVSGKYDFGLYFLFAAVTCNWLAVRFIRRDEKLVRDSDRIR